jgi:hypothetical protein
VLRLSSAWGHAGERQRVRNEGYSLLYELAGKEQDVDKVLILKSATKEISAEIKDIARLFARGGRAGPPPTARAPARPRPGRTPRGPGPLGG